MSLTSSNLDLSTRYMGVAGAMSEGLKKALENSFESMEIPRGVLRDACGLLKLAAHTVYAIKSDEIPTLKEVNAYVFIGEILRGTDNYNSREEVDVERVNLWFLARDLGNLKKVRKHPTSRYKRLQQVFEEMAKIGEERAYDKWCLASWDGGNIAYVNLV